MSPAMVEPVLLLMCFCFNGCVCVGGGTCFVYLFALSFSKFLSNCIFLH